jgi:hypothetical protein
LKFEILFSNTIPEQIPGWQSPEEENNVLYSPPPEVCEAGGVLDHCNKYKTCFDYL